MNNQVCVGREEVCIKEVGAYYEEIKYSGHLAHATKPMVDTISILPTHSRDSIKLWVYQIRLTVCTIQPSVTHNKLATLIRIKQTF